MEIFGLGIFAIPENISRLRRDRAISDAPQTGRRLDRRGHGLGREHMTVGALFQHLRDHRCDRGSWRHGRGLDRLWTRGANHIGQTQFRQRRSAQRDRAKSANNAKEGGGLVPTLLFGIPGSGSTAIFIGAIALLGSGQIEVGPAMLKKPRHYLCYRMATGADKCGRDAGCIAASGSIAKLTTIHVVLLAPFLFMIISFAAFQSGQELMDLVALFAIGLLGILMRRFDLLRPAFLIGFVLSNPAENYANQAVQIAGSRIRKSFGDGIEYMFTPIVIVRIIIIVLSVVMGLRQTKSIMAEDDVNSGSKRAPMVFLLIITGDIAYALFDAASVPDDSRDRVLPMFVASVSLLDCVFLIARMMLKLEPDTIFADRERQSDDSETTYDMWSTLAWFAGLLPLASFTRFIIALALFLFRFIKLRAKVGLAFSAAYTGAGIAFICGMAWLLNRDVSPGLLQDLTDLPWPFT